MDHLTEDYGISNIQVEHTANDISNDIELPKTKEEFHRFPRRMGWNLGLDYKLEISGDEKAHSQSLDTLLTAWLFFGLIFVVVQKDGQPILKEEQLHAGGWLRTKDLNKALKIWADWEKDNPEHLWARMIQVEYVLEKARQVVRKACGYNIHTQQVGYHTDPDMVASHLTDEKAMALMTLGECLWQVKARIMQESEIAPASSSIKASLEGWHGDDEDGWGPPRWVFMKMAKEKWCPRAVLLLKGQLRSNATLLLQAYHAYKGSRRMVDRHEMCTSKACVARTENNGEYSPLCVPGCRDQNKPDGCKMVGPDMEDVRRVLESGLDSSSGRPLNIPVLKFEESDTGLIQLGVEAVPLKAGDNTKFATISHVWSDGWGNERENKLHDCQLKFIRRQLQRVNDRKDILFWMDTLLVPVKEGGMDDGERKTKKMAIGQIFEVFERSTYTIVLDNGLCNTDEARDEPTQTAMKILASSWMRRLWTLQEAFVSSQLHFVFKERRRDLGYQNLVNYDELDKRMNELIQKTLKSPLIRSVRDMLDQNIMGQETHKKQHYLYHKEIQMPPEKAAFLVVSAWSAARWRTTSNSAHETLALATLLDLNYQGTQIENAGLTKHEEFTSAIRDQLICEFWQKFHESYGGAIPPGIIFLPGEKVSKLGFGWAPTTWLSAHEVDYPNPLSRWSGKTDLLPDSGLRVKYPGFFVHTVGGQARRRVLGMNSDQDTFTFPASRDLVEWYSAKPADPTHQAPDFLSGIASNSRQLAIILSRPRPVASPPEIGLLVEIYDIKDEKIKDSDEGYVRPKLYHCQIIRRMHVWREMDQNYLAGPSRNGPTSPSREEDTDFAALPHWGIISGALSDADFCLGESIPSEQRWLVDGHSHTRLPKLKALATTAPAPRNSVIFNEPPRPTTAASNRRNGLSDYFRFPSWLLGRPDSPQPNMDARMPTEGSQAPRRRNSRTVSYPARPGTHTADRQIQAAAHVPAPDLADGFAFDRTLRRANTLWQS